MSEIEDGDNRVFQVSGRSAAFLRDTLALAFQQAEHKDATHWGGGAGKGLVLYWTAPTRGAEAWPLPAPTDAAGIVPMVERWLDSAHYGPQPDTDGHNEKGWVVYCEEWGHVGGDWAAIVAIKPHWITYGK